MIWFGVLISSNLVWRSTLLGNLDRILFWYYIRQIRILIINYNFLFPFRFSSLLRRLWRFFNKLISWNLKHSNISSHTLSFGSLLVEVLLNLIVHILYLTSTFDHLVLLVLPQLVNHSPVLLTWHI